MCQTQFIQWIKETAGAKVAGNDDRRTVEVASRKQSDSVGEYLAFNILWSGNGRDIDLSLFHIHASPPSGI